MSKKTEGRTASEENPCAGSNRIVVMVGVDRLIEEIGYRSRKTVEIDLDLMELTPEGRRTLARVIRNTRESRMRDPSGALDLTCCDPSIGGLPEATPRALEEKLARIRALHEIDDAVEAASETRNGMVRAAVGSVFRELPVDRVNFSMDEQRYPRLEAEVVRRVGEALPPDFAAHYDAASQLKAESHRIRGWDVPAPEPVAAWLVRWLEGYEVSRSLDEAGLDGHARTFEAFRDHCESERAAAVYARSPKGMVEAVLAAHGTPSQVERWREDLLPQAEVDAVVGAHLFEAALAVAGPEARLGRDEVAAALRQAVPGAGLTKVSFATEEADGLDEVEWDAFKKVRAALPAKATANVVRTVANVQTASHGSFVLRRALATLKGRFGDRDVRIRLDLGTGLRLADA